MDQDDRLNLLRSFRKFIKSIKFPTNHGELSKKYQGYMGSHWKNEASLAFLNDLFPHAVDINVAAIKQTIDQPIQSFIENSMVIFSSVSEEDFPQELAAITMSLHRFIGSRISQYFPHIDHMYYMMKEEELIEFYNNILYKKLLESEYPCLVNLKFTIENISREFENSVSTSCLNSLLEYAVVNFEDLDNIFEDNFQNLSRNTQENEWVLPLKKEDFKIILIDKVNQHSEDMLLQNSNRLSDLIGHYYYSFKVQSLFPFDESICSGPSFAAFKTIVLLTIPRPINQLLEEDLKRYFRITDFNIEYQEDLLENSIKTFLFSSSYNEKLFYLLSLVIVVSRVFRHINPNIRDMTCEYSPSLRHWMKELMSETFQHRGSFQIKKGFFNQNLFDKIESYLAKQLKVSGIEWTQHEELYDMSEYLPQMKQLLETGDASGFSKDRGILQFISDNSPVQFYNTARLMKLERIKSKDSLHTLICVSGWLSEHDNMKEAWSDIVALDNEITTYALRWSSCSTSQTMKLLAMVPPEDPIEYIIREMILGISILTSFWPAKKKAEDTGRALALALRSRWMINKSSVSLIGFSLGARLILNCLATLHDMQCNVVQDVVIMGTAADSEDSLLISKAKQAAHGRFVNVYCHNDLALRLVYKVATLNDALGIEHLKIKGVENYDITDFCSGHSDYRHKMSRILELIRFNP